MSERLKKGEELLASLRVEHEDNRHPQEEEEEEEEIEEEEEEIVAFT